MSAVLWFTGGALWAWVVVALLRRRAKVTVDKDGHWHFPIETLEQMLAIPPERRARFLAEMPAMFRQMWALLDQFPMSTLPGSAWVDDGKGEFRPRVVNEPANSGEAFAARPLGDA